MSVLTFSPVSLTAFTHQVNRGAGDPVDPRGGRGAGQGHRH